MSPNLHLFPNNPYVAPSHFIAHNVWILDCKTCHTFLTNRAMKAVLLLIPSVSLYSSDAFPMNCSPSPSKFRNSATISPSCECLTQSLFCQGCGTAIGYMIIIACNYCTGSVAAKNTVTNGHRFVFYSSEVLAVERHYIKGEPGIISLDPSALSIHTAPEAEESTRGTLNGDHSNSTPTSQTGLPALLANLDIRNRPVISETFQIQPGDLIWWHHLQRSGEIPRIVDDERGRSSEAAKATEVVSTH